MSKVETISKVSLELTTRMNVGRRGARVKLSILDIVHKPLHGLERVKQFLLIFYQANEYMIRTIKGRIHCEIFLSEYFMKY